MALKLRSSVLTLTLPFISQRQRREEAPTEIDEMFDSEKEEGEV